VFLLPIIVPIYVDGERRLVTTEWKRSLELLRDSLPERLLPIVVLAPWLPAASADRSQCLEALDRIADGIELDPAIAAPSRARHYWLRGRARWRAIAAERIARATVVQCGLDDLRRPLMFDALKLAFAASKPTVFVQDTDVVVQMRELAKTRSAGSRLQTHVYSRAHERGVRWCVARADLSLLKGRGLMRRYGPFARNAKEFHDTNYTSAEIVPLNVVLARTVSLASERPVRLVYCGRLVARKGVDSSIRLLHAARARGASIELDVIGDGEERPALEALVQKLDLAGRVRFLGSAAYGPGLLRQLAEYDALFFTPTAEDTPRMIFDGYASGLPLIGSDIGYVVERAHSEAAAIVLPRDDREECVARLVRIARDRAQLATLACAAHAAAEHHAADQWYARRAAWVLDAIERTSSVRA
jgi:glycosyltransferase involved in cell wall biosynthesis